MQWGLQGKVTLLTTDGGLKQVRLTLVATTGGDFKEKFAKEHQSKLKVLTSNGKGLHCTLTSSTSDSAEHRGRLAILITEC